MQRAIIFSALLTILSLAFIIPITLASSHSQAKAVKYCKEYLLQDHWGSGKINAISVSDHYALCAVSDEHTGNMFLFKETHGKYLIIASGKPTFEGGTDLENRGHVPPSEATLLWNNLKAALPGLGYS